MASILLGGSPSGDRTVILLLGVVPDPLIGLITGMTNGAVIGLLSLTPLFRSAAGVSRSRVSVVAAITTSLTGFAILYQLYGWVPILVCPPVAAGTLLAVYASGKLPPVREPYGR